MLKEGPSFYEAQVTDFTRAPPFFHFSLTRRSSFLVFEAILVSVELWTGDFGYQ